MNRPVTDLDALRKDLGRLDFQVKQPAGTNDFEMT